MEGGANTSEVEVGHRRTEQNGSGKWEKRQ